MLTKVFVLSIAIAALSQAPRPSNVDRDWLNKHRDEAFDRLMPIASAAAQFVA